jgi:hypothetical protein
VVVAFIPTADHSEQVVRNLAGDPASRNGRSGAE